MRRWSNWACAIAFTGLLPVLAAAPAAAAAPCDEYDPFGPAAASRITLDSTDFVDRSGDELRSFIATDSIGKVDVAVVASTPRGSVGAVAAIPAVSRFSADYGEELKGIAVAVSVRPSRRPVRVVLAVRQVCAKYFRDTFLYY